MTGVRVVLADDHALVRSGLRALLETMPGVEVVGEAGSGREALQIMAELAPDVVLMDITMPDMNGLTATERIRRDHPKAAVLVVSMHGDPALVAGAMRAGASGYLIKNAGRAELAAAVMALARGGTHWSVTADGGGAAGPASPVLSPRQREILLLIAEGHTTREIALRLGVSVKTAESHRTELMRRLDLHDVAGLVRYAVRTGVVSAER